MRPWLLPTAWAILIFLGSSIPGNSIPKPVSVMSLVLHACEYAVLVYLIARALHRTKKERKLPLINIVAFAFIISMLYAATDEFHQFYVPGRHPDPLDLGVDMLGSGAGVISWLLFTNGRHSERSPDGIGTE